MEEEREEVPRSAFRVPLSGGARTRPRWHIPVLLATAVAVRFAGLGSRSLWLDEAYSLDRCVPGGSLADVVRTVARHDAHPPFYYLCLHLWTGSFGESPAAMRSLSAVVSVLAVLVLYRLCLAFLGPRASFATGLLFALSAFQVEFAQEARHYATVELLLLAALLPYMRLLTPPPPAPPPAPARASRGEIALLAASHGLLVALALYTFYYSVLLAVPLGLVALVRCFRRPRRNALAIVAALGAAAFAFLPWLPRLLERARELRAAGPQEGSGFPFPGWTLPKTLESFAVGTDLPLPPAAGLALALLLGAALATGLLFAGRSASPSIRLPLAAGLLGPPVLVAVLPFRAHLFEAKHLVFVAPLVFLAFGALLDRLDRLRDRGGRAGAAGIVGFALFAGVLAIANFASHRIDQGREKEDWRSAARHLEENLAAGDEIACDPGRLRVPLVYALREGRLDDVSPLAAEKDAEGWKNRLLAADRVWLVEVSGNYLARPTGAGREILWELGFRHTGQGEWWPGSIGDVRVTLYRREGRRPP
ncbi:MAG: glycosyltransferase family 39 protein [Planctomycetes bacterium]|nr:glycosyltransferase family 39 protein [Planctomycetota bacterium]